MLPYNVQQRFKDLIKKYPKVRASLPKPVKKIFNKHYLNNRNNFFSQLIEKWLHLSIDDRKIKKTTLEKALEH
jgi:hypothetical protein